MTTSFYALATAGMHSLSVDSARLPGADLALVEVPTLSNIDQFRIKAIESKRGCPACLFRAEGFRGCVTVCDKLVQRGLPDCDDKAPSGKGYVYVLDETDPRQMNLLDREH